MIYLITGAIGTGKTTWVTDQLMQINEKNEELHLPSKGIPGDLPYGAACSESVSSGGHGARVLRRDSVAKKN